MKERIISMNELSDTRELLDARPPRVLSIFIYLLCGVFLVSFAWMWFGYIDVVIKATCIIRPLTTVSLVRNIVAGEINGLFFKSGDTVKKGDVLYVIDSSPFMLEMKGYEAQAARKKAEMDGLLKLKKSIVEGENHTDKKDSLFSERYFAFMYRWEELTIRRLKAKEEYERNNRLGSDFVAQIKIDELKSELNMRELEMNRYKSEIIGSLQRELVDCESEIEKLKERADQLSISLADCRVEAPINGKVQEINEYNTGDYLQSGIEVFKIIPSDTDEVRTEILVSNKDIANVKIGSELNYSFSALPRDEYSAIKGKILSIPEDISTSAGSEAVYLVWGSLSGERVTDKGGNPVAFKAGMIGEARIVVSKRRIINLLLDTLDFS